jgi:hypothetical protein
MNTEPLPVGTMLKERYRVTRLVAGGGMAWVYEAEDLLPNGGSRVCALKELRADTRDAAALQEAQQLFAGEANLLVRLSHPNLPQVRAYFQERGRSYLVMEFVHGESLARKLDLAQAPLFESQVLDWGIQICAVLDYLHSRPQPIIFRDLKPSNVMVTLDGRIKLIDFGIARVYKRGKRKDTVAMGSENYAAPEQWGQAQSDPRADLYGLGATLYHLLTNMPPLPAFVPGERVAIAQYNPAVTAATVAVIDKAMAMDRDARYASAIEMRQALLACLPRRERLLVEARSAGHTAADGDGPDAAPSGWARPIAPPAPDPPPANAPVRQSASTGAVKGCPLCQAINRTEARFCSHCGYTFVQPLPPVLALIEPQTARWEYPLGLGGVLIGRPRGATPVDLDLSFYDPEGYVSRNHARIQECRRRYQVVDLNSANGTYINGYRLTPEAPYWLRQGDKLRLGRVVLEFRIR